MINEDTHPSGLNPKPQTPHPNPQNPNLKPQTPNPKPQNPYPKPQTPNPRSQTLNPKLQNPNFNPKPYNPNPKTYTPQQRSRGCGSRRASELFFFFFINLQTLKKWSTTNYAPLALGREPGALTEHRSRRAQRQELGQSCGQGAVARGKFFVY